MRREETGRDEEIIEAEDELRPGKLSQDGVAVGKLPTHHARGALQVIGIVQRDGFDAVPDEKRSNDREDKKNCSGSPGEDLSFRPQERGYRSERGGAI